MSSWIAVLQFPLVYLPLMVMGLGVFGSDFDELPGRLFIGLFLCLPILDRYLGKSVERATRGIVGGALLLVGVILAGLAYRPVHLGYWDEHSASQAFGFCALGLASWAIHRLGAARIRASGSFSPKPLAGALLCLAPVWLSASLYPLLPTLGLGALYTAIGFSGGKAGASVPRRNRRWRSLAFGSLVSWGALLVGIDLFLVVWDCRLDTRWGWHLFAACIAASVGAIAARRWGGVLLGLGAANFVALVLFPAWVLCYGHSILAGAVLGVLLEGAALTDGDSEERGGAPLGYWPLFWFLGLALGLGLHENLAFAPWRVLLFLPPIALAILASRRTSTP
jgi:hypothetical protein